MRSASPPTGTTERAGIAEASTAGETSGRGVVPGPAQHGETSTVDQSREWPYRDTAPRQDPAESRGDPIWGSDPPDAVRWHMGMTPTDQDAPAARSPNDQSPSRPEVHPSPQPAATDPNPRPETENGAASSPLPEARQRPEGQAGERERAQPDEGATGSTPQPEGLRPAQSAQDQDPDGEIGGEAGASTSPQNAATTEATAGEIGTGASRSPVQEPSPTAPHQDDRGDDSRMDADRAAAPAAQAGVDVEHGDRVAPAAAREARGSAPAEPTGPAADSSAAGGLAAGGPAAGGPVVGGRPVADPSVADPSAGGSLDDLESTIASGAPTGDAQQAAAPPTDRVDRAPSAPPASADAAAVGWFSTSADPERVKRALSGRVSAERPGDEPLGGPTPASQALPENPPGPDAGPGPTDRQAVAADAVAPVGLPLEESPGVGGPHSLTSEPVNADAPADMGSSEASRSPELIESGMVYVDPDPEIGSPPKAAGWGEPPQPAQPSSGGPAGAEEKQGIGSLEQTVATPPRDDLGRGEGDPRSERRGPQDVDGQERQGQHDTGDRVHQGRREPGDQHGASGPQHQGFTSMSANDGAPDDGSSEDAGQSTAGETPWTEPALPMGGLPPGPGSSVLGGRQRQPDEDATDEPLIPTPDPSWPRLFEQRRGAPPLRGTEEASVQVPPEPGPDAQSTGRPGTAARTGLDAPASHPATTQRSDESPAGSAEERRATVGHPASEAQPGDHPGIVGLAATEPPSASGNAAHDEQLVRASASAEGQPQTSGVGAPSPEQANISTVAQIVDAAEVDLRDSPVGSPNEDVSRETSAGGGEGMDPHEGEAVEDEAALAVREAVSRAAAEAGVDVSRETSLTDDAPSIDEFGGEPSIDSESAARAARVSFRIHRESLNGTRRVVAVANQKGGVGKSTTAVNIGAYLALAGARVLVADLDPQGNASTGLGLDHRDIEPSIYDVLTGDASPTAAIRATGVANLHVLPSTIDLAGAEVELVSAMSRETRLRRALESIDHQYDTILIDCPPSLGLLTVNALAAADELLIPIQCEYYALEGLGQLLRNVELVRANLNPELRIGGIVLTMYDGRTRLALQVVDEVRKHFTDLVYQTVVPRSVRLSEAPGYGLPIALYDPLSRGGIAYRDLTFELAERSGLLAPTGEGAS